MAQSEATDEWLMSRLADGWEPALEQLMERYHGPLFSFIRRQTDLEAEDIYQESWLRVVRNAKRFDAEKKFSTWLFQIALNLCRDAHRRRLTRRETASIDDLRSLTSPPPDEDARAVRSVVETMAPADREIITLRYYLGYRETDVADILDIPLGTVKGRTHQAVGRLKQMIEQDSKDGEERP